MERAPAGPELIHEELKRLERLHSSGRLSDEELAEQTASLLLEALRLADGVLGDRPGGAQPPEGSSAARPESLAPQGRRGKGAGTEQPRRRTLGTRAR
ncbi:MAG: hypothetical protein K6T75_03870 [Acetobacteraceae bacterium]|nr:hypothetical protein [Acetobacteraceae bacterium]